MATTVEVLRSVPLFEGMSDDAVATIAGVAEELVYPAGSELTRQGYPGESFIVIVTGRASVDVDGQRIRELGAGEYLGERLGTAALVERLRRDRTCWPPPAK